MERLTDEKQIRDVVKSYNEAYEVKDVDKVMSLFSDDTKRIRPYAAERIAIGKNAVRVTFEEELDRFDNLKGIYDIGAPKISGNNADVVYNYYMEGNDLKENGVLVVATGKGAVKLRKTNNTWKISELEETVDSWHRQD